jgi:hypothetical protein
MGKLSEGSQISISSPRRRDFFLQQLSLIPSPLHFLHPHLRYSTVSIPFLRSLQLHLLSILLHLLVSILLHASSYPWRNPTWR